MVIGVETSALTPKPTGTSRYIRCLLDQLRTTEHQILSFTPFSTGRGLTEANHFGSLRRHWYRMFQLGPQMHWSGVDCGIFPNYLMPPGFQKKAAVVIHDLSFLSHPHLYSKKFVWYYTDQIRRSLKQDPVVVTLTEHSKYQIQKYLPVMKDNVLLVQAYATIRPNSRMESSVVGRKPYFLFVGHIEPRKNLVRLVQAFESWKKESGSEMELRIIGDVWIRNREIRNMLEAYRHSHHVRFMGYVPDDQLNEWYSNASGLVHTSLVEGFGFPVLEAMHFGIPIMCSKDSPMQEIAGNRAVQVDPTSVTSIRHGLSSLLSLAKSPGRLNYDIPYGGPLMQKQIGNLLEILSRKNLFGVGDVIPRPVGLDEAVMKTLIYASLFGSGIPRQVLHERLVEGCCTKIEMDAVLDRLVEKNLVTIEEAVVRSALVTERVFIRRSGSSIPSKRRSRILRFLQHIPLVHAMAASGGFSHETDVESEDLDLFLITKPYTVYIVYALIHFVSLVFRWRNLLCPNYLVDQSALRITHQQDFYTSHQIVCLRALKNPEGLQSFWRANRWIQGYFPNFPIPAGHEEPRIALYVLLQPLNWMLMRWYQWAWKKRLASAVPGALQLTRHIIKLHMNDHRPRIRQAFDDAWQEFLSKGYRTKMTA